MVILDTSLVIDHLTTVGKQPSRLERFIAHTPQEFYGISLVTLQELYAGKSTAEEKAERFMLETIAPYKIFVYDYDVALVAGKLVRTSTEKLYFADAAIAATAIIHECPLATLNEKDFSGIKNLTLLRV